MSPAEIGTVLSSLKSAGDMAKALMDLRDAAAFQSKAFDLTREILNAQQCAIAAQSSLAQHMDEVRGLKAELARYESWASEEKRYALKDFGDNTFAYELKDEFNNGEPKHRLCPTCFQKRVKSILQSRGRSGFGQDIYVCNLCRSEYFLGVRREWAGSGPNVADGWMGV